MLDYGKRLLIVLIFGICISLMFIGGIGKREVDEGFFTRKLNENVRHYYEHYM
ncbi:MULTISPECIES: hypothetical protein [Bacillaceae]|uniref:Uncharacterized protein n=1 Tax=Peribacillus huizhouensis TaxID=1501239 RepID=A0ABR6CQB6_9BACI|nr:MULTISPECIES: hypothetical protein [Bacillaceae]MBA9027241.1 hypothetical protein [Peribacillus huizhouensis]